MRRDPSIWRNRRPSSVTVNVQNVEEDPSLTLSRLQVRAGEDDATVMATLTDPDYPADATVTATYQWYVPKVNRPELENEDHWIAATGTNNNTATYMTDAADAGKYLRVIATYTDPAGTGGDKAYARSAHPVAAARTENTPPSFSAGTPMSFSVSEHAAIGTVIGTVRASDVDSSDILTHELSGSLTLRCSLSTMATGRITVASKLNYEDTALSNIPKAYTFSVTAFDPSGAPTTGARPITVEVGDQNDAPGTPTVGAVTGDRAPTSVDGSTYMVDENHPVKDVDADETTEPDYPSG